MGLNIQSDVSLLEYNTFGIDVLAERFVEFSSEDELAKVLRSSDYLYSDQELILGAGSNILLTTDFDGIVLKNNIKGITVEDENEQQVIVKVGAGEVWHDFVLHCINNNWCGLENLSLIPGNVGAAPMQNIGAYGVELKDMFYELQAIEKKTGRTQFFDRLDCHFGYRTSIFKTAFKNMFVITSVTFLLNKKPELNTSYGDVQAELDKLGKTDFTIRDVSNAVIKIRQSKLPDPAEIGNAGSFFKNPVIATKHFNKVKQFYPDVVGYQVSQFNTKLAAGWLIEHAGWKGKTFDNYGVHKDQALVLVNYGGADGKGIYDLSEEIVVSVQEKFGIDLEREVNIL